MIEKSIVVLVLWGRENKRKKKEERKEKEIQPLLEGRDVEGW
jgi:hypothetical protein